jgi:hypothetical protein
MDQRSEAEELREIRGNAGQVASGIRRKATKRKLEEKKRAKADR